MWPVLNALVPVFACIALGYGLKRYDFPGNGIWAPLNKLVYYVFYPVLLIENLATAQLGGAADILPLGLAMVGAQLAMTVVLAATRLVMQPKGPQYSSMFQGAVRWNGFVALAAIAPLYGQEAIALAAIALAFMVPTANVLSVFILARHAGNEPVKLATVANILVRNPLLIACVIGIGINASGVAVPSPILGIAEVLGDAALTIGLLCVGAGLEFVALRHGAGMLVGTTLLKLVGMPILAFGTMSLAGVSGLPFMVGMVCASVPGATSSYILARQLGGDAPLMAGMITASTLVAALTMPLVIILTAQPL